MKIRRFFAAVLSLAMILTMAPTTASAAENGESVSGRSTVTQNGLTLTKKATLEEDGTYTIDLEAFATGKVTTIPAEGTPLDIVLVIDQSGSMAYNDRGNNTSTASDRRMNKLQTAVRSFVGSISQNADDYNVDHRIAIAGYASDHDAGQSTTVTGAGYNGNNTYWVNTGLYINGQFRNYGPNERWNSNTQLTAQDYRDALVSVNDANDNIAQSVSTAIDNFKASGGTYTEYGLRMAEGVFQNNSATYTDEEGQQITRKRIVVLFTDGETDSDINTVLERSNNLKNTYNADVYCVGFGSDVDTDFLSYVSSNYMNSSYEWEGWGLFGHYVYKGTYNDNKYSMTASNSGELEEIFDNISEDIQNPTADVDLDENAVLKDVMAAGFKIPDNYDVEKNVSIKTVKGKFISEGNYSWTTENNSPEGILPKVNGNAVEVTGFDYAENFIGEGHDGYKLVVQLRGILPTEEAVTNEEVDTNDSSSGIYAAENPNVPAGTFPEPKTILTSKAFVLDYAKETALTGLDQNTSVTAIVNTMKAVSSADSAVTGKYGNSALAQNSISYTPKTTNWDGYDNLYVFGKTTNETVTAASANANGNLWSKVSVIPANNVYYEDDFETNETDGTVGIKYTGNWTTTGSKAGNTETANGDVQGWETSLADDATYSDGSAHVSSTSGATATFTFTGTGVDIYSRTDMTTGTVLATLTGNDDAGTSVSKALIVDNYAESYDDGDSTADGYYQIPTLSFDGLAHGTYTVTIRVTTAAGNRSTYYLDGIRVYNPIQDLESDETVQNAYGEDELNAAFTQVRDMLDSSSTVFIDEDADGNAYAGAYDESTYEQYGPKNEVYLAAGQAIVFNVSGNGSYYVGLKAPAGETKVALSADENAAETTIGHASDLYYRVTPDSNGYVTIKNNGDNLLSVTKLRTAGSGEVTENLDAEAAVQAYNAFSLLDVVSYDSSPVTDDELTGNESEDSSGTVTEEPGDVEIENPEDYDNEEIQKPEQTAPTLGNWINKLFNSIKDLFLRW